MSHNNLKKVSWLDSTGQPSHIHLTPNSIDTLCGGHREHLAHRQLTKAPKRIQKRSNYCRICFANVSKNLPWVDCLNVDKIDPHMKQLQQAFPLLFS